MPRDAIGLDIGGANLKAATSTGQAIIRPFELWRYPDRLATELAQLVAGIPAAPLAVTMTGELCDCFPNKRDGVRHILAAVRTAFHSADIRVWSTTGQFLSLNEASDFHLAVAAANWHALATFVGRLAPRGAAILVDCGSTTTDLIPLVEGRPVPTGRTDPERMRSSELVYLGVRRTPVCALLGHEVAAELFATMHDVYLRLGFVPEEPENRNTADGRPSTRAYAHGRLARMLGGDAEMTTEDETDDLARRTFDAQRTTISAAIRTIAARLPQSPASILLAGSGEFLARAAVEEWVGNASPSPRSTQIVSLAGLLGPSVSSAACAYAVAVLAAELDQ
jgi:(4-(4-[2-(gamma-L-glutamylamino)ethyl]phenoxymethyl)furan-2-yl)methanamine synthase